MKHSKTFKKEEGKVIVDVSLWISSFDWETDGEGNAFRYDVSISFIPKGKRKQQFGDHEHRVTKDEIHEAKMEFWNNIKPN